MNTTSSEKISDAPMWIGVWFGTCVTLGILCSNIPWGDVSSKHYGTGWPIPVVIWAEAEGGTPGKVVDFPFPAAVFLNPLIFFLSGLMLWAVFLACRRVIRRLRGKS